LWPFPAISIKLAVVKADVALESVATALVGAISICIWQDIVHDFALTCFRMYWKTAARIFIPNCGHFSYVVKSDDVLVVDL